jgi:hypothetical protein
MVLDRDYPTTPLQRRVLAIGLVVMIAIGIALFGGFLPGVKPNFSPPSTTTLNGHEYFVEATALHGPLFSNSSAPWNVTFHNVTFELRLTNWYSLWGGIVHFNGTEANGTRYMFALGQVLPNGSRAMLYVSPDSVFAAWWLGGLLAGPSVQLLVEVSYSENLPTS